MKILSTATRDFAEHIALHMRVEDQEEIMLSHGATPKEAIDYSYAHSEICDGIEGDDGMPIGLCGVCSDGTIWMVGTDELTSKRSYRIDLIKKGREWVDSLLKTYNVLYNYVYAENTSAIKWLKALGFTFIKLHPEYGHLKKPFYEFVRIV